MYNPLAIVAALATSVTLAGVTLGKAQPMLDHLQTWADALSLRQEQGLKPFGVGIDRPGNNLAKPLQGLIPSDNLPDQPVLAGTATTTTATSSTKTAARPPIATKVDSQPDIENYVVHKDGSKYPSTLSKAITTKSTTYCFTISPCAKPLN